MLDFGRGDGPAATASFGKAFEIANATGGLSQQLQTLVGMGVADYSMGRFRSCERHLRRALSLAEEHDLKRIQIANYCRLGIARLYNGSALDCLEECDRTIALAERFGEPLRLAFSHEYRARTLIEMGDYKSAMQAAIQSSGAAEKLNIPGRFAIVNIQISTIARLSGDLRQAREYGKMALDQSRETATMLSLPWALIALAFAEEDAEKARALREEALVLLSTRPCTSHNHFHGYSGLIEWALDHQHWDEVDRFADLLAAYTEPEPLRWSDFVIGRARELAAVGRGARRRNTEATLRRLVTEAEEARFGSYLPRLMAALSEFDPT
jgi:tetratricopeptide (TPR) repeat protein